ncbi:hypothetical protein [Emticicia sp. TH156]|uniref:hypothetical protein n=1 Tax=Emticicia sp. TH156 TaxID=2067454 RepID=UPI00117C33E7|nr:hypothetical protein [Emticicia sp. TH156]
MFTNISWQDYLMAVSITLIVYYVIIGFRYYAVELKDLVTGKRKLRLNNQVAEVDEDNFIIPSSSNNHQDYPFERTGEDEFAEVEELISRLKETIQHATIKKYIPQELKNYLRLLLQEYPTIKTSLFRSSVNEFIVSECEKYGSLTLTEQEVDLLWNEAVS